MRYVVLIFAPCCGAYRKADLQGHTTAGGVRLSSRDMYTAEMGESPLWRRQDRKKHIGQETSACLGL